MRERGGFTLLELMVTLALLGLVYAAATSQFHRMFASTRMEAGGDGIADHFTYAVSRAYTTGRYHTFVFDLTAGRYWIALGREDEDGEVLLPRRLATGVSFTEVYVGPTLYQPPGTLSIEISPLGVTNDIVVNLEDNEGGQFAVALDALVQSIDTFPEHKTYEDLQDVPAF